MSEFFGDVLDAYIQQTGLTVGRLARLTGLPKPTLESWQKGAVKKPRVVTDILRVAAALRLTRAEADRLLRSAGLPDLAHQFEQASARSDKASLEMLGFWMGASTLGLPESVSAEPSPFQALPDLPDFIGRQTEITELRRALTQRGAVCVLHGMGGVGKTSLAAHLAYILRPDFPDGVLWAELHDAPLTEEEKLNLLASFARAYGLDVRAEAGLAARSRLVQDMLARKRLLLVLDNAFSAADVRPFLMPDSQQGALLITTRQRRLLSQRASLFQLQPFAHEESKTLLETILGERVAAEPTLAAQLIQTVGGLPLALRVAAGYLQTSPTLTLREYHNLLTRRDLEYLADWEDTTRNVRACFEVSYQSLPPDYQTLFNLLSLFEGPSFSEEAVAALQTRPLSETKIELGKLKDRSLIELAHPAGRYRLHPLLKLFAREKTGPDSQAARQRLASHFAQLTQTEGRENYPALDADWENLQAVLDWAQAQHLWSPFWEMLHGLSQTQLGLVGYLDARGYWREALRWLSQAEATGHETPWRKALRAFKQGVFNYRLGRQPEAMTYFQACQACLAQAPPTEESALCRAYVCEFMAQSSQHDGLEEALNWCQQGIEALSAFDSTRLQQERGYLLIRQGSIWGRMGHFSEGQALTRQGLALMPAQPAAAQVSGWINLGLMALMQGELDEANGYWQKAMQGAQFLGDYRRSADIHQNMAWLASKKGLFDEALTHYSQARQLYQRIGDVAGECRLWANSADDLMKLGRFAEAGRNLEQALALAHTYPHIHEDAVLALINSARLQLYRQQITTAPSDIARAEHICHQHQLRPWQAIVWRVQAQLALAQADLERALALIQRSLDTLSDEEERGVAWRIKADILAVGDEASAARLAYQTSLDILQTANQFEYAVTHQASGRFHLQIGQLSAAHHHLTQALTIFEQLSLTHEIEHTQSWLDQCVR